MNLCILGSVKSLKVSRFVDGDVSVDCHEDDDVDRAGHEGVDQWQLKVGLILEFLNFDIDTLGKLLL